MNRRAFFCGLAVSPLAALATASVKPKTAEQVVVSLRLDVDDSGLVAFVESASKRATAAAIDRYDARLAGRLDEISVRQG